MKVDVKEAILFAISRYDYAYAYKLAERAGSSVQSDLVLLLEALAERRELNIQSMMNLKLKITGSDLADFQLFCRRHWVFVANVYGWCSEKRRYVDR